MQRSAYFRPRGALARTFYDKLHKDEELRSMDKDQWYKLDEMEMTALSPEIWRKFRRFNVDEETEEFLDNCFETSDSFCWQLWLTIANSILSWFLTPTSINGLLGRGSMMVYSSNQFEQLIDFQRNDGLLFESLLDIGAGDGSTTDRMKRLFHRVHVTEMSKPMKWSLANKGFTVLDEQNWDSSGLKFDVVTCLNVLDRCDTPLSLLRSIKNVLNPDGIAVVAFVIPFSPYVEFGDGSKNHKPNETLPVAGKSFSEEVFNFVEKVLEPEGWELLRWTRLPYLCHGNIEQAFYWLNDSVFVIRPKSS